MKRRFLIPLLLPLALGLAACGNGTQSSTPPDTQSPESTQPVGDSKPGAPIVIKVGATPAPHAAVLEVVKELLKEQNIDLQIQEFDDYILPNTAVEDGSLDANYFQHITYMEGFNAERGTHLVNAAGIQRRHPITQFPMEDWDTVLEVNLTATFQLCQLAGRQFIKQDSKGKIVNIASMLSFFGGFTVPAYAASKGGVAQLTKALSNEWSGKGINVNAIAPGYMATEMNTALINDEGRNKEILGRIPAHRWGAPEDMKGLAIFLASAASDYVTGAVIPVDGGYLAK